MREIDIGHLYKILVEYQKLDPGIARRILKRILKILDKTAETEATGVTEATEETEKNKIILKLINPKRDQNRL